MRAFLFLACASCAGAGAHDPTLLRSYKLPLMYAPLSRVAIGFPLVLEATRHAYAIAETHPEMGVLLTAPHRAGNDDVAFLVSVTPQRRGGHAHVELSVTVETVLNGHLMPPERVPAPILDEENRLLATVAELGEPYEAAEPP